MGATTKAPGLVTARTAMSPCRAMSSTRLEQILSQPLYKEIANDSGIPKGASATAASSQSSQRLPMVRDDRYPALERMEPVSSSTSSLSLGVRSPRLATAGVRLGGSEDRPPWLAIWRKGTEPPKRKKSKRITGGSDLEPKWLSSIISSSART